MIRKRFIFPLIMFSLAGVSFAYGIWQHVAARQVQAAADQRLAFMATTLEQSSIARSQKNAVFAALFEGLPSAPTLFGIDLSGSFASEESGDACRTDGQRAVCRALKATNTDEATYQTICGLCSP